MRISNSQIQDLQVCELRFYFAQVKVIRPIEYPESLEKGITGHSMFELFFKAMQEGKSYEECVEAINPVILQIMGQAELMKVYRLVLAFGTYAFDQPWKVVHVERNFSSPIELGPSLQDDEFVFTPDVVMEWTKGPKKGSRFMLDFKFTSQYWTDHEVNIAPQLPKYMIYYNKEHPEAKVRNVAYVFMNTRAAQEATGNKLFLLKWAPVGKHKLERVEFENEVMMGRVKDIIETNGDDMSKYMRTVNTFACKRCFFADLCDADLNGQDITKRMEKTYIHNDYFDDNYGDL